MEYIKAKISIPDTNKGIVSRQRIYNKINASISDKAIYLSAPAGYGKTTALAGFANQADIPCAWYSLDETDNNPIAFLKYLAKSIASIVPEFSSEIFNSITDAQTGFEALIIHLQKIERQFIIVLDDFHLINNKIIINQILRLIKYKAAKIIIASRYELITEFEEMLLRQKLHVLTKEILVFDNKDIEQFLDNKGKKSNEDDVNILKQTTQGWVIAIVGLVLNDYNVKDIKRIKGYGYINRFLQNEVWDKLDEREKEVLKHTAFLSEFYRADVEALTGYDDCDLILNSLMNKCLFISHHSEGFYKYHHMFGEFVCEQISENEMNERHNSAAQYFANLGKYEKALNLLKKANNKDEILGMFEKYPKQILMRCDNFEIANTIESIIKLEEIESLRLLVFYCWALFNSKQPSHSVEVFKSLKSNYEKQKANLSEDDALAFEIEISTLSFPFAAMSKNSEWTLQCLKDILLKKAKYNIVFSIQTVQSIYCSEFTLLNTSFGFFGRNRFHMDFLDKRDNSDYAPVINIWEKLHDTAITKAEVLYEFDKLHEAYSGLSVAIDKVSNSGNFKAYLPAMICLSNICVAKGDFKQAYETIVKCRHTLMEHNEYLGINTLNAYKAMLDIKTDCIDDAMTWKSELSISIYDSLEDANKYMVYIYMTLTYLLIKTKRYTQARMLLDKIIENLEKFQEYINKLSAYFMDALLSKLENNISNINDKIVRILEIGYCEGYVRTISDYGEDAVYLLDDFETENHNLSNEIIDYYNQIVTVAKKYRETINKVKHEEYINLDLTYREKEILIQLSGANSNQEIANALYLSIQTVKNHTRKIYKKLGVSNRREAVNIARKLDIV